VEEVEARHHREGLKEVILEEVNQGEDARESTQMERNVQEEGQRKEDRIQGE
jgi:hypothetical protein